MIPNPLPVSALMSKPSPDEIAMIDSETIPHYDAHIPDSAPHVMVIDDDPGDIELMRIAFEMCQIQVHIDASPDGMQAVERLRQAIAEKHAPELIILDLNLPRMDGCDVMTAMRGDGLTERIPVVVVSTSQSAQDKERCLKAGASAFYSKPDNIDGLLILARTLYTYFSDP
jgi:two-component system response regulator